MTTPEPKECPTCGVMKPIDDYYKRLRTFKSKISVAYSRRCKQCTIAHGMELRRKKTEGANSGQ